MSNNDQKYKTILSRSLKENGDRIIMLRESGRSCDYKITEEKVAQWVKHGTTT